MSQKVLHPSLSEVKHFECITRRMIVERILNLLCGLWGMILLSALGTRHAEAQVRISWRCHSMKSSTPSKTSSLSSLAHSTTLTVTVPPMAAAPFLNMSELLRKSKIQHYVLERRNTQVTVPSYSEHQYQNLSESHALLVHKASQTFHVLAIMW